MIKKNQEPKLFVKIGDTEIFQNGHFQRIYDAETSNVDVGSIWEYQDIVSVQFNQLKGKLFNVIDASIENKEQRDALKGLIKGFCNEHYNHTWKDIRCLFGRLGFEGLQKDTDDEDYN